MSLRKKLTRQAVAATALGGGLLALSGIAYAATLNQNLWIWPGVSALEAAIKPAVEAPPVVIGRAGASLQPQQHAQAKTKTPAPTPAAIAAPSSADIVNKLLNPGPSDPDVPLPHPDLANDNAADAASSQRPRIFGRGEDGGGVFGFRVPIPADRSASGANTRSGSAPTGPESVQQTR